MLLVKLENKAAVVDFAILESKVIAGAALEKPARLRRVGGKELKTVELGWENAELPFPGCGVQSEAKPEWLACVAARKTKAQGFKALDSGGRHTGDIVNSPIALLQHRHVEHSRCLNGLCNAASKAATAYEQKA